MTGIKARTANNEFEMAVYLLPSYFDCYIPIDDAIFESQILNLETCAIGYNLHKRRRIQYDEHGYKLCKVHNRRSDNLFDF